MGKNKSTRSDYFAFEVFKKIIGIQMRNSVAVGLHSKPYATQFQFLNWNWYQTE